MSEVRVDAFEMGKKHKEHEMLTTMSAGDFRFKKHAKEAAVKAGLSQEIENLLVSGDLVDPENSYIYRAPKGMYEGAGTVYECVVDRLWPSEKVSEEQLLKTIEELPGIEKYGFCRNPEVFTKRVMKKLLEKSPDVEFCCSQGADSRMRQDLSEVLIELGQEERAEQWR